MEFPVCSKLLHERHAIPKRSKVDWVTTKKSSIGAFGLWSDTFFYASNGKTIFHVGSNVRPKAMYHLAGFYAASTSWFRVFRFSVYIGNNLIPFINAISL